MKHDWYPASGGGLIANLWTTTGLKVALLGPGYVPNPDAHTLWAHVSGSEIAGPGYTAGGQLLAGKTTNYDAANDRTNLVANDNQWTGATFSAAYAVVYDPASGALWSLVDFQGVKDVAGGVFTLDWAAIGVLYVTKA